MKAYFVMIYDMAPNERTWSVMAKRFTRNNEEECYAEWKRDVERIRDEHPKARMTRCMDRRTAEEAFADRESSIASCEWIETIDSDFGPMEWRYRVTMYVVDVEPGYTVEKCAYMEEWRVYRNGVCVYAARSKETAERYIKMMTGRNKAA